jgi:cytochrome c556
VDTEPTHRSRVAHAWIIATILFLTVVLLVPAARRSLLGMIDSLRGRSEVAVAKAHVADLSDLAKQFAAARKDTGAAPREQSGGRPSEQSQPAAGPAPSSLATRDEPSDTSEGEPVTAMPALAPESLAGFSAVQPSALPVTVGVTDTTSRQQSEEMAALRARIGVFRVMEWSARSIVTAARFADNGDRRTIAIDAQRIGQLALMLPDLFQLETDRTGLNTRARPNVWSDRRGFVAGTQVLATAADRVVTVAQGDDAAATRSAVVVLAKACAGCHDAFMNPAFPAATSAAAN